MSLRYTLQGFTETPGQIGLDTIVSGEGKSPTNWNIDPNKVNAEAIPSPFANSERITASFRVAGIDNPPLSTFQYFENICLGIGLGIFNIEMVDLKKNKDAGRMGDVLTKADTMGEYRYLGLITNTQSNGEKTIFAATGPQCLFWPHPRRTSEEWDSIAKQISDSPDIETVKTLWAEWRGLLNEQGLWEPMRIPWMRGIDWIIQQRKYKSGMLARMARSQGPVLLAVPDKNNDHKYSLKRLYLPTYDNKIAADIFRTLFVPPAKESNAITIQDNRGSEIRKIKIQSAGAGASTIMLGTGVVEARMENIGEQWPKSAKMNLDSWINTFSTIFTDLASESPSGKLEIRKVAEFPFSYPDPVRMVSLRLGAMSLPGSEYTSSFSQRTIDTFISRTMRRENPDFSFRLPMPNEVNDSGDFIGFSFPMNEKHAAIFLEQSQSAYIGDLAALGYVMWAIFSGAASIQNEAIFFQEGGESILERISDNQRPFIIKSICYERMMDTSKILNRLATLQRFSAYYKKRFEIITESNPVEELLYSAYKAFINKVYPGIKAQGPMPLSEPILTIGDYNLKFACD